MKIKYLLIVLFFSGFLTACTGTGTTNLSAINLEVPSGDSAVFIVRKKKFQASLGLVKVLVDGREVAKLGVGEMERVPISPGSHKVSVTTGDILQLGMGGDNEAFIAEKGKSYFFIADYEQGFWNAKWSLTPTNKSGFTSAAN